MASDLAAMEDGAGLRLYAERLIDAYRAAQSSRREATRCYQLAGNGIRLRFAGTAMLGHFAPAFAHAAAPADSRPALTVCLFDSASTGIELPSPPCELGGYFCRQSDDGRLLLAWVPESATLSLLDAGRDLAVCWTEDARRLPAHDAGSPLMVVVAEWMKERGYRLIHAAAVGRTNGGVLLAGKGGSGKSTSAFACLDSELRYLSDDYCLLGLAPAPHACGVYGSARLSRDMLPHFPRSSIGRGQTIESGKHQFMLDEISPGKLIDRLPLRAILLPVVGASRDTFLRPAKPMQALRALAPSTILQLPGRGDATLRTLATLVRQIPSYTLELGPDLKQIPRRILELLS